MGMFDWLLGRKSEKWYRHELDFLLIGWSRIHSHIKQRGSYTAQESKDISDLNLKISDMVGEMRRYSYRTDDLLTQYHYQSGVVQYRKTN